MLYQTVEGWKEEKLEFFRKRSEAEVDDWDRALSEQAASTESFLMSNVNRAQDKRDFLTSFKKVVMMPVNILPSLPTFSSTYRWGVFRIRPHNSFYHLKPN